MILKALYDYYNRCGDKIAPLNMAYVPFYYAIVIDNGGNFIRLETLGNGDDGLPLLTFRPEERTSAPIAHMLGDNGSYVLGLKNVKVDTNFNYEKEIKANQKNHACFIKDIDSLFQELPNNVNVSAIHSFYQRYGIATIKEMEQDANWKDFCKHLDKNITFRIQGDEKLAASDTNVIKQKEKNIINENKEAICLITGYKRKPVSTTYSTFVGGKSNAKLVAFQINSGYDSYGKKMGMNAPISEEAEFKYTTALLKLLSKGSHNKFNLGNRTFVFWASSNDEASQEMEDGLFELLGFSDESVDDPNAKIEEVRKVFKAISSGVLKTNLDDRFYILGLAPNSARIAVVYWSESSLRDFAAKIEQHFSDMEIVDNRKERKPYMGLRNMLSTVTQSGKLSDVTPNLPESVAKSIFEGTPYPYTLFSSCIRRIRAESGAIRITRAAIMKAYLNRLDEKNQKKITIMLDKQNLNPGYLCGRLFAVLENLQYAANGQDSIRASYMNAASSTPSAVFPTILKLSNSHYSKLAKDKKGLAVFFDNQKKEIMAMIQDFPDTLELSDQGRFFLGYYHQKNYKENKEIEQL
jgi:CRISPR-associated protein Csd1